MPHYFIGEGCDTLILSQPVRTCRPVLTYDIIVLGGTKQVGFTLRGLSVDEVADIRKNWEHTGAKILFLRVY